MFGRNRAGRTNDKVKTCLKHFSVRMYETVKAGGNLQRIQFSKKDVSDTVCP